VCWSAGTGIGGAHILDRSDLVEHLEVPAGKEGPTVDDHVDLVRARLDGVPGVVELDGHAGAT